MHSNNLAADKQSLIPTELDWLPGPETPLYQAAVAYASNGFRVVPNHAVSDWVAGEPICTCSEGSNCGSPGKHPRLRKWEQVATDDVGTVVDWWTSDPDANIGIVTGGANRLVALDIDGDEGRRSLVELEALYGDLPTTLTQRTGGNGEHRLFRLSRELDLDAIKNSAGQLGRCLDIRANRAQIIASPSVHRSGRTYRWLNRAPIEKLPLWLYRLIADGGSLSDLPDREAATRVGRSGRLSGAAEVQSLEHACRSITSAQEGSRNDTLNRQAFCVGRLVGAGSVEQDVAIDRLTDAAAASPSPLPADEIEETIRRAVEDGKMSAGQGGMGHRNKIPASPRRPAGSGYNLTDLGNAERFELEHHEHARYVPPRKSWLLYNGARWEHDETKQIERLATTTVRRIYQEAADENDPDRRSRLVKHAVASERESRIRAMLRLGSSRAKIPIMPSELDADPWKLNVLNGTLDLRTGQLHPHRPEDLITKLAPVVYDPKATCPIFDAFLDRILGGSEDLKEFLKRAIGYSITGDVSEHALFIEHGDGANGKSTLNETVSSLLGDYARNAEATTFLARRNDAIRNDLAMLHGARFVPAAEIGDGRRLDEALVKQCTGGDTITARFLHREFFDFQPQFKVFLSTNYKPVIRGTDIGIWRRIRLIPFAVTIPKNERDKQLVQKLRGELSGILRWAVEGCLAWQASGLDVSPEVAEATREYRDEMDPIGPFLDERCTLEDGAEETTARLKRAYDAHAEGGGYKPVGGRTFTNLLKQRGLHPTDIYRDGAKHRGWSGIELRD